MAKHVGQVEDRWDGDRFVGKVETCKVGRVRTTEIPLTPAPKTGWQKFKRAAVG